MRNRFVLIALTFLALVNLLLVGCVGPMTYSKAKLPDGAEIRAYRSTGFFAPSVTVVALRPAGTTNWTLPHAFSGPGLVPGAATGGGIAAAGALIRPDHHDGGSVSSTADIEVNLPPSPPSIPKFPPGHGYGNKGH